MEPTKPALVGEAERVNAAYLKKVVAPFVAWALIGSFAMAPIMPAAVDMLGEGGGVFAVLSVYMLGLAALMVPLIKKGMEIQWTKAVLQQWSLTKAKRALGHDDVESAEAVDPRVGSARQMATRVQELLQSDQSAGDAAVAAASRAEALLAERDSVLATAEGLGEGEGAAALRDAAGALEAEAVRAIDALANLYAAVAAQRAAVPAAAEQGIAEALARLEAEAEVAGQLLSAKTEREQKRRARASAAVEQS